MSFDLETVRNTIPASARGTTYAVIAALAPALIAWGLLGEAEAAAWVGLLTAVATLVFAILHSTSGVRTAIYSLVGAVTVVATVYGYGSPEQWDTILAIVAPALGMGVAAANTPTDAPSVEV